MHVWLRISNTLFVLFYMCVFLGTLFYPNIFRYTSVQETISVEDPGHSILLTIKFDAFEEISQENNLNRYKDKCATRLANTD